MCVLIFSMSMFSFMSRLFHRLSFAGGKLKYHHKVCTLYSFKLADCKSVCGAINVIANYRYICCARLGQLLTDKRNYKIKTICDMKCMLSIKLSTNNIVSQY